MQLVYGLLTNELTQNLESVRPASSAIAAAISPKDGSDATVSKAELDAICARVSRIPNESAGAAARASVGGITAGAADSRTPATSAPAPSNPYELYSELQRSSEFRLDFGPGIGSDPQPQPQSKSSSSTAAPSTKQKAPATTGASASGPATTPLKSSSTTVVAKPITVGEGMRVSFTGGESQLQPTAPATTVIPNAWSTPRQIASTATNSSLPNNSVHIQEVRERVLYCTLQHCCTCEKISPLVKFVFFREIRITKCTYKRL